MPRQFTDPRAELLLNDLFPANEFGLRLISIEGIVRMLERMVSLEDRIETLERNVKRELKFFGEA